MGIERWELRRQRDGAVLYQILVPTDAPFAWIPPEPITEPVRWYRADEPTGPIMDDYPPTGAA